MEPTEVIDLSSDDEKSPLKVKNEAVEIDKINPLSDAVKNDTVKQNINDNRDLEILYGAVRSQKRTIIRLGETCPIKKLKLSDDCKPLSHDVVESESQSKDLSNLSKTNANEQATKQLDKLPQETPLSRCLSRSPLSGMTIATCDESSLCSEIDSKTGNLGDDKSRVEDEKMSRSARESSRSIEDEKMSPSTGQRSRSVRADKSSSLTVKTIRPPQLVVKSRVRVLDTEEKDLAPINEMFQSFLDTCSNKDSSNDMMEILRRLKKRFNNLEPGFAKSESFMHLIRNKRDLISNNASDTYRHMLEVRDEMKARQVSHNPVIRYDNENEDLIDLNPHEKSAENCTTNEEAGASKDSKEYQQLRALEKAMRRCQRYINKCEMAEVDFNDEEDSHYVLAEKYKYRMVELYNKYCEITGEPPDAGRPYLRPKNITVTPLPLLNNAIASFINTKIMKMNNLGRTTRQTRGISFAEALIFPDYVDILNCVKKCNNEQNLQLSKAKEKQIAKQAFTDLGEHLQCCRKRDYYDTFSLYLEQEYHDPASDDESLAAKLRKNHEIGKKKLNEVFEEFVVKQNAIAENGTASNATEKSQDDRSDKSGRDTDSNSEESENEVPSSESNDDIVDNEDTDSSTRLQGDSKQNNVNDVQVVRHAEKKNPTETSGEASNKVSDEKMSLPLNKTVVEGKTNLNTNQPDGEESKENVEILIEKKQQKEITLPTNEFSRITVRRIGNGSTIKKYSGPGNNEKRVSLPIPTSIQKPASIPVTSKEIAIQPAKESDVILADNALPTIPVNNNEVIVTPAIASSVKTTDEEDETKPILRPRSFAKASAFWEDIESSTSGSIANTGTSGQAGRGTAVKKVVKVSPDKLEQIKSRQLTSLTPLQKTVQVKTDVSNNSQVKKMTVMIPSNVVSGSTSTFNVQSVTNNITVVNIRNQSEFMPKITSVVSYETEAPQTDQKSGKNGSTVTQSNERVMNVTFNENSASGKADVVHVATDHNQHTFSIKKPTNQVTINMENAGPVSSQRQYKILSPKNMSSQIQTTNIHNLSVKDINGKPILYKLMKSIPTEPKKQKTNITRTVAHSETSHVQNQRPGINEKSSHIKVPNSGTKSANKTCDASADKIPTYVIE